MMTVVIYGSISNLIIFFTQLNSSLIEIWLSCLNKDHQKWVEALGQKFAANHKTWHHLKHTATCITELGCSFLVTLQHVSGDQHHSFLPQ